MFSIFININYCFCITLINSDSFWFFRKFCMVFSKNNSYFFILMFPLDPPCWEPLAKCFFFFGWNLILHNCKCPPIIYKLFNLLLHKLNMLSVNVSSYLYFYISLIYRAEKGIENYKVMFIFCQYCNIDIFVFCSQKKYFVFKKHIAILFVLHIYTWIIV